MAEERQSVDVRERPPTGRRRLRYLPAVAAAAALLTVLGLPAAAQEPWPPPECVPAESATLITDVVGCVAIDSGAVGGRVPVSYLLPASCVVSPCPVLYLLHGFGGSYTSMLGTADAPSAWVAARTSAPPVDPASVPDPWNYADPAGWVPAEPLDVIMIAPHGRTVPGGYGPAAGLDSFWADWNPRYAAGGSDARYDTPPPRFETFLFDELIPWVETHLPTRSGRGWRGLTGVSLGGFGAFKNGLQHPDVFAAVGSVSGAHNFLFAPSPGPGPDTSAPAVVDIGGIALPSLVGGAPLPPGPAQGFAVALTAFGDSVADQPYYRGNMPVDLARNGDATTLDGTPSLVLRYWVNDAVPRRGEDLSDPGGFLGAEAFELIVLPMNLDMELAFDAAGVQRQFRIRPGLHSGVYWNPWLRHHLEELVARLAGPDGGAVPPEPDRFDYRTIRDESTVWGWRFTVAGRPQVEFLDLTDVSCTGLTLRGTGRVTVSVPERCATGLDGQRTFTVDLGPSGPVLPTGVDAAARTVTVALAPPPAAGDGVEPGSPAAGATPTGPPPGLPATGAGSAGLALLVAWAAARRPRGRGHGRAPAGWGRRRGGPVDSGDEQQLADGGA